MYVIRGISLIFFSEYVPYNNAFDRQGTFFRNKNQKEYWLEKKDTSKLKLNLRNFKKYVNIIFTKYED